MRKRGKKKCGGDDMWKERTEKETVCVTEKRSWRATCPIGPKKKTKKLCSTDTAATTATLLLQPSPPLLISTMRSTLTMLLCKRTVSRRTVQNERSTFITTTHTGLPACLPWLLVFLKHFVAQSAIRTALGDFSGDCRQARGLPKAEAIHGKAPAEFHFTSGSLHEILRGWRQLLRSCLLYKLLHIL